ncbi:MAG: DUF3857 domain-containing protein, partial [Pseudomonadota bacterium]
MAGAILLPLAAVAQSIEEYLSFEAPAAWVAQVERPEVSTAREVRDIDYLLVDRQTRHTPQDTDQYFRYVEALGTKNGVEENSAITIDFDPAYQTVTMHHLVRIRDGAATDVLNRGRFDIYRTETRREHLIYDGRMQLSYLIPDVRVDDVLDYAFTIHGKNPAIAPHFAGSLSQGYSVPVQHLQQRLVVPGDTELHLETHGDVPAPRITERDGSRIYHWEHYDLAAISVEDNLPHSV